MGTDSSSEPKQGSPSFFKVVRDPSAPHLSLPIAFVRRYSNQIPKHPILTTATREHSWRLKIKKIGEDYCFTHGWEKLAQDAELRIKDVLVFWLIDSCTFQVSFFNEHGCEKDLPLKHTNDGEHDADDGVMLDQDVYFHKVYSEKNHKCYMVLPKKFVDAAGLEGKSSIKMRDKEGKEWEIGVRTETYRNTRLYLSSGWSFFRRYHDLCDGDMCLFRYIKKEGVMILAELIKNKRPTNPQSPVLKRNIDGGGVEVKVEHEEMLKRKKPLLGGDVAVKIEDEEVGVVEIKTGTPPLEKLPCGGVKVKIEDESCAVEVEAVKGNSGEPPVVEGGGGGGGGGEVRSEPETERVVRHRHIVYF